MSSGFRKVPNLSMENGSPAYDISQCSPLPLLSAAPSSCKDNVMSLGFPRPHVCIGM